MKRIIVYYSLSGNTEEVVKTIAERLGCETLRIDTVKAMPKSFAARILVGGGQVVMNKIPEIKPIDIDFSLYDEIFIGTPIWNSKGVPAINAFLSDDDICRKVTGLIITSGGGDVEKCVKALEEKLPNVKYQVSLLDRKHKDYGLNDKKITTFIEDING
ncbi:MAG: flavodoxin [Lachnospiraceae bacterium]|nr:flavodoxin [Lachnospiraceae bacterium]